jgi:hypothetical protein
VTVITRPEAGRRWCGLGAPLSALAVQAVQAASVVLAGCGGGPIALHAPNISPSSVQGGTAVELEPVAPGPAGAVAADIAPPGPAAVLTAAMTAEIAGRGLRGGEPGGYVVRCTLDRFAPRWHMGITQGSELLVLYVDLSCEARRASDRAIVFRGELRGRTASAAPNVIGSDSNVTARLVDRAMSDAAREMASDLATRALALQSAPSARVFADETQLQATAGLDDAPYGPAALQENPAAVAGALRSLGEHDAPMRAAAWNVAAMAAGPGDPWPAGSSMKLDDDPLVRFVQYKALARFGGESARARLQQAAREEDEPLLVEFVRDALATDGTGLPRSRRR